MQESEGRYFEEDEPPKSAAFNPAELLVHAVGRFPLTVVGLTLLGIVVALVYSLSLPNTYKSVGMLFVKLGVREQQTVEAAVDPEFDVSRSGITIEDQLMMLQNPALRERVVRLVGPQRILRPYDARANDTDKTPSYIRALHEVQAWLMSFRQIGETPPEGSTTPEYFNAAVNVIEGGTSIGVQRRTNTIVVEFTATDDELAKLVAEAYIKVFQSRHREVYEMSDKQSFVSERLAAARTAAGKAREAMTQEQERTGFRDVGNSQAVLADSLRELETENLTESIRLRSLKSQLATLEMQLAETPKKIRMDAEVPVQRAQEASADPADSSDSDGAVAGDRSTSVRSVSPYSIDELLERLALATDQLSGLGEVYSTSSEYYQTESARLEVRIRQIEDQIQALRDAELGSTEPGPRSVIPNVRRPDPVLNPVHTSLVQRRLELMRECDAMAASIEAREVIVGTRREQLESMFAIEPVFANLQREVFETELRVAELEKAHLRLSTLQLIDADERLKNILVTQEPFLPRRKEGPQRAKFLLGGLALGLAAGLGTALARQFLDPKLRYPSRVESVLGLRVLGVVPEDKTWRSVGKTLKNKMRDST